MYTGSIVDALGCLGGWCQAIKPITCQRIVGMHLTIVLKRLMFDRYMQIELRGLGGSALYSHPVRNYHNFWQASRTRLHIGTLEMTRYKLATNLFAACASVSGFPFERETTHAIRIQMSSCHGC